MIETCLKCGHVNNSASGSDTEACPNCCAVYSKVELAISANQTTKRKQRSKNFWTYAALIGLLTVLAPIFVYQHTWGVAARQRKSEASLSAALAQQRIQEKESAAKAKRASLDQAVAQGVVVVGMSEAHVRATWGNPTTINRTVTGAGASEQWIYRLAGAKTSAVYLTNGVVRSYQTSE